MQRVLLCSVLSLISVVTCMASGARAASLQADSNIRPREANGQTVQSERDEQQALFNYYFRDRNLQYETELSKLKTEGSVPSWRIPYSAAIHPETAGGMSDARVAPTIGLFARRQGLTASRGGTGSGALSVYDRAFNGGQGLANSYEAKRIMGTPTSPVPGVADAFQFRVLGGLLQRLHRVHDQASGTDQVGRRGTRGGDSGRSPAARRYQSTAVVHL